MLCIWVRLKEHSGNQVQGAGDEGWIKFGNHKLRQQIKSGTQQLFLPDQLQSTNAHFSQINQKSNENHNQIIQIIKFCHCQTY